MGVVLLRLRSGLDGSIQGRINAAEQWESVNTAISVFLERTVADFLTTIPLLDDLDALSQCDKSLQELMYFTARLSPSKWSGMRRALIVSIGTLPAQRGGEYLRRLEQLGHAPRDTMPVSGGDVLEQVLAELVFDPE